MATRQPPKSPLKSLLKFVSYVNWEQIANCFRNAMA